MSEFFSEYGSMILVGIWQTLYMTLLSTLLAYVIGLPTGVLLSVTSNDGIRPNGPINRVVGFVVNILRSVPFLILMILVIPLTRAIVGTSIGSTATIVPLTIAAAPFVARMVEASLSEVDKGIIEAAWSMGSSPMRIVLKVLLPEARSSLLLGGAISVITILGYSAMAGILAGGGLGDLAIRYGFYRYKLGVMAVTVILLIIIVMILQALGEKWAKMVDRKINFVSSDAHLSPFGFAKSGKER